MRDEISLPDAVVAKNIHISLRGEEILKDVSLTISSGDVLAILGPNGGGKTTLLRTILGLTKPDSGTVEIFGKPPQAARRHIGYVPQFSTIRQDFPAAVLDVVLMGAAAAGRRSGFFAARTLWPCDKAAKQKALELLERIGIAHLAARPLHALSGGQRQRAMIARALMGRENQSPFILLLDEPTASIDAQGKWCFFEFLGTLKHDVTMVVVSHELAMASSFFNKVALVDKTLTFAPPGSPNSEAMRAFIGVHAPDCPVGDMISHNPARRCEPPKDIFDSGESENT